MPWYFDNMKKFHGLGQRERLMLQIAVLLHACGKFISIRNSNECSYNIIMSTEIIGLSHLEREIIANVVRYNIRDFDYDKVQLETQVHPGRRMPGIEPQRHHHPHCQADGHPASGQFHGPQPRGKLVDCRMAIGKMNW